MSKPDNVARFFFYLSRLRTTGSLHYDLVADGISLDGRDVPAVGHRQFLDDLAYLKELLPLWEPGTTLEPVGDGRYKLVRTGQAQRLSESEFLPFLEALSRTTNLFPYPVEGWLGLLSRTYITPALKALENRILYTSTPHPDRLKQDHFHSLVQSILDQKRVNLSYRNREGVIRNVDFEPMLFLNHNGIWYLVGDGSFEHRTEELSQPTQLKLSRIGLCKVSERPFQNRFDLTATAERLRGTYGSHLILEKTSGPQTVTLRFFGEAVGHVRESWFHTDQVIKLNDDQTCDLTLMVNDLFDALQLMGQWGSLVQPLEPSELVNRWRARNRELGDWTEAGIRNGQDD